ncbi:MAG TPA: alpha-1,2-fucosyltransferase [Bacteroidia bacterium]
MIIIKLQGGIGNQMFQYAFGKYLSLKHNTNLKLDLFFFGTQSLRKYELEGFSISGTVISREEFSYILNPRKENLFIRGLKKLVGVDDRYVVISEAGFEFDPSAIAVSKNSYLSGYWQCEKYFKDVANVIRKEFVLKDALNDPVTKLAEQIRNCNSVSIHVRRGDYVTNELTNRVHGVCGKNYYDTAVNYISGQISNPVFFFFSDDIAWVKQNMTIAYEHYFISNEAITAHEELHLMSLCNHNIIANSSFSWWGAWLNNNQKKIVIAPKNWFADETLNNQTNDLIPHEWKRI